MTATCLSFQHYSDISNVRAVKQIQLAPKPIHKSRKMMHITTAGFPICWQVCNQSTVDTLHATCVNGRVCKWTGEEEKYFQFCWSVETGGHIPDKFHHHREEMGHTPNSGTTESECVSVRMQLRPFAIQNLFTHQKSVKYMKNSFFPFLWHSLHRALLGWGPSHATSDKTDNNIDNWKYITNCAILKCFAIFKQLFQVIWRGK